MYSAGSWLVQTLAIKPTTVIVAVAALLGTACSSNAAKSTGASTTAPVGGDATTTTSATTVTTASPTTVVVATTAVEETTTTVASVLTPARNIPTGWVAGAQEGDPEVLTDAGNCQAFYDAMAAGPYSQSSCGVWTANDGQRTWTVTRGASGYLIGIIWQQIAANDWVPVLRAVETTAGQWDEITIVTGNTDSGPADELIAGTRIAGASGKLAISLIDIRSGNPRVVAVIPTGNHGVAVFHPGVGIEMWSAVEGDAIPKCCPLEFTQSFLVAGEGGWFIETRGTVPSGDPAIPTSEF